MNETLKKNDPNFRILKTAKISFEYLRVQKKPKWDILYDIKMSFVVN